MVRSACSGGIIVVGERKMVPVSMNLFTIAATAFLVVLALAFLVFSVKYIRTRARGRGPLGMFSQPRHTFAQYDDEGEGEGEGIDTGGEGAKTARGDGEKSG
jgi:hypothetical protein